VKEYDELTLSNDAALDVDCGKFADLFGLSASGIAKNIVG
jgi:hypothetical protein